MNRFTKSLSFQIFEEGMIYVNQTGKKSVFWNVMSLYLGKKLDNLVERGERTLKSMKYLGGWGVCEILAK